MSMDQASRRRIVSLDQFRGYTVVGMLFVNFLGGYQVVPAIFKHHNTYCSYADTIMPQFFFAVGFAYRLTFLGRLAKGGVWPAAAAVLKRNAELILLGFVIYHLDGGVKSWAELQKLGLHGFFAHAFQRELFQTLVHIAITSIWILPVIAAGTSIRIIFMIASAGLHLWLSSRFYLDWASKHVIDGGPLGFLTWTIPTLVGSLAYDAVAHRHDEYNPLPKLAAWSVV
jgi:predicted acyltransferase